MDRNHSPLCFLLFDFFSLTSSNFIQCSENISYEQDALKSALTKDHWELKQLSRSFTRTPTGISIRHGNNIPEHFPLCSQEEAEDVLSSPKIKSLHQGYKDCALAILTGKNPDESLRRTPHSISILDPNGKPFLSSVIQDTCIILVSPEGSDIAK